jgi:hypothetical protein
MSEQEALQAIHTGVQVLSPETRRALWRAMRAMESERDPRAIERGLQMLRGLIKKLSDTAL